MIVSFSAIYNEDGEVSGYLGMGKIFWPKKNRIKFNKPANLMKQRESQKLEAGN
jgi:hypothetical protein